MAVVRTVFLTGCHVVFWHCCTVICTYSLANNWRRWTRNSLRIFRQRISFILALTTGYCNGPLQRCVVHKHGRRSISSKIIIRSRINTVRWNRTRPTPASACIWQISTHHWLMTGNFALCTSRQQTRNATTFAQHDPKITAYDSHAGRT